MSEPEALEALAVPTVHLNGTSKQALLDQVTDTLAALRKACDKLAAAAPHGRDYSTQPNHAWETARRQHEARLLRLRAVEGELELIGEAIADQGT